MATVKGVSLTQQHKTIRLSTYFLLICISCILCVLIISPAAFYTIIAPSANRLDTKIAKITASQVADGFQAQVNILRNFAQDLQKYPTLQAALRSNNSNEISNWEKLITDSFSLVQNVIVIPVTDLNNPQQVQRKIGYADYDVVQKARSNNNLPIETHYHGTKNEHLQITKQIIDTTNQQFLGILLLDVNPSFIRDMLKHYNNLPGFLELRQKIDNGNLINLFTIGDKANRIDEPTYIMSIKGSHWHMAYWQKQDSNLLLGNMLAFAIAIGTAITVFIIGIIYAFKRLDKALNSDLTVVTDILYTQFSNKIFMPTNVFHLQLMADYFCRSKTKIGQINKRKNIQRPSKAGVNMTTEILVNEAQEENITSAANVFGDEKNLGIEVVEQEEIIPETIFRKYDIRGVVDESLTENNIRLIGQALGTDARRQGIFKIVVGRDGRLSGPKLVKAFIEGILSTGVNVMYINLAPTPVVYHASQELSNGSCAVITGSHNPPNHNGIKMMLGGVTLAEDRIKNLYHRITRDDFMHGAGKIEKLDYNAQYERAVVNNVRVDKPLKVVIDCGNGIAGAVAPKLFERLGCNVVSLYSEVDGNFPNHHPDPSVKDNLKDLINTVVKEQADVGLAFDGDADRLGVVTNTGEIVWPDQLLMMFVGNVLQKNPGSTIIYDVKCTRFLAEAIQAAGGKPVMWKTGHSLIKAKIKETNAVLAGEMSGHFFFNDRWDGFDDAIYAGARLLELLSQDESHRTLQTIFDELPKCVSTPELKIAITEDKKQQFITNFAKVVKFEEEVSITKIDGMRVDFHDGWGLIRPSNTTACLVLRFEADNQDALDRIINLFRKYISEVDAELKFPNT